MEDKVKRIEIKEFRKKGYDGAWTKEPEGDMIPYYDALIKELKKL